MWIGNADRWSCSMRDVAVILAGRHGVSTGSRSSCGGVDVLYVAFAHFTLCKFE